MELIKFPIDKEKYKTKLGEFKISCFTDGENEAVVFIKGNIGSQENVILRIQTDCIHHTLYCSEYCDCNRQIKNSLEMIHSQNRGLMILLAQDKQGLISRFISKDDDKRNFDIVSKIIDHFDIKSVRMITINKKKIESLEKAMNVRYGHPILFITDKIWYRGRVVLFDESIRRTVVRIRKGVLHKPISHNNSRHVLVVGDLNVDYHHSIEGEFSSVGGSGYNAWMAFGKNNFESVLFGSVGLKAGNQYTVDDNGKIILNDVEEQIKLNKKLHALIGTHKSRPTGKVIINRTGPGKPLHYVFDHKNANDYDIDNLDQTLTLIEFDRNDYVFISSHVIYQNEFNSEKCKKFFEKFNLTSENIENLPKIVIDLARHMVVNRPKGFETAPFCIKDFNSFLENCNYRVHAIIGEYSSFITMISCKNNNETPDTISHEKIELIRKNIRADYIVCRHGFEGARKQTIIDNQNNEIFDIREFSNYEYESDKTERKIGFGDMKTVEALELIEEHERRKIIEL